jgi:hypothetical protein
METLFALCFARFLEDRQMCLIWSARRRKLKICDIGGEEDQCSVF